MKVIVDTKLLGQTIRTVRKFQGLTQEQLAATCGVGIRFIRELEKGKESCHLNKVLLVLKMLGMHLYVDEGDI